MRFKLSFLKTKSGTDYFSVPPKFLDQDYLLENGGTAKRSGFIPNTDFAEFSN